MRSLSVRSVVTPTPSRSAHRAVVGTPPTGSAGASRTTDLPLLAAPLSCAMLAAWGCLAVAATLLAAPPARAAGAIKLPASLTISSYDTGSSGFNMAVAVGKALKDRYSVDLRVLPAGNDVARLAPLKAGRAQVSAAGIGIYHAQEGVFEFAAKAWGPQPLRLILSAIDCHAVSLGVAKDTGVTEVKDLRGKRIGIVAGSPALNQNAYAVLAFGNLTAADIQSVEFPSYAAMWKGIINNEADAGIASTISGQAREAESSSRGLLFPATPAGDDIGWKRIRTIAPYYLPHRTTCGPDMSAGTPKDLPSYPYPIFMTYAKQPVDLVRNITAAMLETYPVYKNGAAGAAGLELSRQNLSWVLPYHDGTVAAMKAAGAWKAEHQAHNDALVRRQEVLGAAWKAFQSSRQTGDEVTQRKAWMLARARALNDANMPVVFAP